MMPEIELNRLKGLVSSRIHQRCPVIEDEVIAENISLASGADQYLKQNIDVEPYSLVLLFGKATFSASTNNHLYLDVRSKPPGGSPESSENYDRLILANNTSSPYGRIGWLLVDARPLKEISIYAESLDTADTIKIDFCSIRKVI